MKIALLCGLAALALAEASLYKELQGFSETIKLVLFSNEEWTGSALIPSNDDYATFCENLADAHPEVTFFNVDTLRDESVWPLMRKAGISRDNTPAVMVHQGGRGTWFFGPEA